MEQELENSKKDVGGNVSAVHNKHKPLSDLMDDFFNKMERYRFYSKELFLIYIMTMSAILLLFYQSNWANGKIFWLIFLVLTVVTTKLFRIFTKRMQTYSGFLVELEKDKKDSDLVKTELEEATLRVFSSFNFESPKYYLSAFKYISNLSERGNFEKAADLLKQLQESSDLELFDIDFEEISDSEKESPSSSSKFSDSTFGISLDELLEERTKEKQGKKLYFDKKLSTLKETINKENDVEMENHRSFLMFLEWTLSDYNRGNQSESIGITLYEHLEEYVNETEYKELSGLHQLMFKRLLSAAKYSEKINLR